MSNATNEAMALAGLPAAAVAGITGNADNAVTAVGTSASDGFAMKTRAVVITGGSSKVVVLPAPAGTANELYFVVNRSGNTNAIYPPSGYTINNTTSVNISTAKSCLVIYLAGTTEFYTVPFVPT